MTDAIDNAQQAEQLQRDIALRNQLSVQRNISLTHCIDCADPIPEKRRQMVIGCKRCIDCQQEFELRQKGFRP
ncbi:TraR/DksA family transcriptional regulator [Lonepinella sp. BR2357]|uniref:TraR/DksA family transcriptional regulator n=1 Tax=Lonepinella sp. BR2357 TaxID=3434549 RepID=UPI003F6DEBAC